jgi:hypothetical protein
MLLSAQSYHRLLQLFVLLPASGDQPSLRVLLVVNLTCLLDGSAILQLLIDTSFCFTARYSWISTR